LPKEEFRLLAEKLWSSHPRNEIATNATHGGFQAFFMTPLPQRFSSPANQQIASATKMKPTSPCIPRPERRDDQSGSLTTAFCLGFIPLLFIRNVPASTVRTPSSAPICCRLFVARLHQAVLVQMRQRGRERESDFNAGVGGQAAQLAA